MAHRQPIISRTDSHDTSRSSTQSTQSFDSHSISMGPSEPTSDERPDLGAAFSTVIRELAYMMQPPLREVVMRHNAQMMDSTTEDSEEGQTHDSYTYTPSAFERGRRGGNSADVQEEEANNSTVWDNRRIASYLASHTPSFTPSQTEPEYMAPGDVSSYPHSTPRTLLQSAFLANHSSPIRESFTPADDHDAYSSSFPQAYEHHDYHSSIINDWESRQLATTMPYIESRSQSQNPSSHNAGDLEEGRAVEIRDTLSSLRSNSLPSSTPDREAIPSPPPSATRSAFSPTDYSSNNANIRLHIDPVSTTPDFPPSASEVPLSTFDYLEPTIRSNRPLRRSVSDDIVNDGSEDPLSIRVPSLDLRSQNLLSSPRSSSSHQSSSIQRSSGPSPQGSIGEAHFRDDSETVPIASSIDSGVLSRTDDEDEYSEEDVEEQRRHTAALRHIVRSGGLDLVREESTEGGVRHEVIRPLILREDSSASDLVLPIEYSGHTKQGSGASGVSSSGSTLSSRNNTLSGSLTISGNGTLHVHGPPRPYTPSAYREAQTSGGNEAGFYRAFNDLNSVDYPPDSTVDELVGEYRQVGVNGDVSGSFDPDGNFDDDVEYPPESESQSEVEDLDYAEEGDFLVDDASSGRPNGNVYIGGRDSVMARSLPNLGRGGLDEDESNEHPQIVGGVTKRSPHVSLVHTSPNPNPSLGYLDAALAYLAAEREKVTKGRSTGVGKDGEVLPSESGVWKGKEREHFDDLVDDDENAHEQDFRSGGLGILGTSGSGRLSDSGKDSRTGWRDILEPRRRSRRKRNDSPSNSTHKSKSSRASTTSTAATILPPGSSWSRAKFTAAERLPSGSKTPKSSSKKSKDNTRSPNKTPYNKPSLDVDTTTSPSSPLSSLNLSIRLPSFATALTPTGTLTSGGENVREYVIFGRRGRDGEDDEDVASSTKATGSRKPKDKDTGGNDERSPKGKKTSKISVPRILKRPAIPFPTGTSARSHEEPDEKLDLDATPVIASAPFFSEPVTPSGRRLLAHPVDTAHSMPDPVVSPTDQEQYMLSSDADESSGLGGDDADDDFHTTGTEGFGSHSDRIPIHRAKSAEGYDRGALEGQSWQQRLLNEHKSRKENKRSKQGSHVRSNGRNSEQVPVKNLMAQRDSHFPDVPGTTNGFNIRDGQQGTNSPKGSKVAKKANHKRHSSDFGRPGAAGKRPLIHARSSPLLRPSEILGSDPVSGQSGDASEGQTRSKAQLPASLGKFDVHGNASLSDANTRRVAQLRVLGQKLRKAFPEDVKSLDQVPILDAGKGRRLFVDGRSSGKDSTKGSGRDSDRFGQHEGFERGSRKRKRSRTRTRRRKMGDAESVDGVDGGDDADDAGDEDEEEDVFWDGGFIDTRGPLPKANDPPIHIFIDHSNILFGLLNYLRRHPRPFLPTSKQVTKHLSHAALTLLLERGRPIAKRVMVASSPLYQPMEGALRLGYEVHIFKRVPHDDPPASVGVEGGDRQSNGISGQKDKGHRRQISGSTSTESDQANFPRGFLRSNGGGKPRLLTNNSAPVSGSSPSSFTGNRSNSQPQKIRYREQGVDELLQLKLSQVLLRTEAPIPGSTIVLATGDGNAGQFNEEGFVEPVRIALQRGWKVELYAWEDGLSRTWRREFGDSTRASGKKGASKGKSGEDDNTGIHGDEKGYGNRFRIIGMEKFGGELVEADGWDLGTVPPSSTTD
ncbi:hypothetical protein AB1N83_007228 [Pleurotus pulmonarius]